jgi:hypothetical protein
MALVGHRAGEAVRDADAQLREAVGSAHQHAAAPRRAEQQGPVAALELGRVRGGADEEAQQQFRRARLRGRRQARRRS